MKSKKYIALVLAIFAGTLFSFSETGREYDVDYTITVKDPKYITKNNLEGKVSKSFSLYAKNMAKKIRLYDHVDKYFAAFKTSDGQWKIWKENDNMYSWVNEPNKDYLEKFYLLFPNNANNTIITLETIDDDDSLDNVSYLENCNNKNIKDFTLYKNDEGFNDLYIFNKTSGTFIFIYKCNQGTNAIKFSDKTSLYELEIKGEPRITTTSFLEWLQKGNKFPITTKNDKACQKIAELLYESLTCLNPFEYFYFEGNEYIKAYLDLFKTNSYKNYKATEFFYKYNINPWGYDSISQENRNDILQAIEKTKKNKKIKTDWEMLTEILKEAKLINKIYYSYKLKNKIETYFFNPDNPENSILTDECVNQITSFISDKNDIISGDLIFYTKALKNKVTYNVGIINKIEFDSNTHQKININVIRVKNKKIILDSIPFNEIENMKNIEFRKLLCFNSANAFGRNFITSVFDVLNQTPSSKTGSKSLSIGKMKEQTQKSPEKYRWIPNTGEYLLLGNIHLSIYNDAGIVLENPESSVYFNGALDRDYKVGNNQGNIYNNSDSNFQISLCEGNMDVSTEKENLFIQKDENAKNTYIIPNDLKKTKLKIGKKGIILLNAKKLLIGIRPENASKAHPGDDLLLQFEFNYGNSNYKISADKNDYISVYDKKMLWRANLYINKEEEELGNLDWNNAHPWNAPPASDKITGTWADSTNSNTYIANWNDTDWGNNEWNRSLKTFDVKEDVFTGLKDLPSGDGGQVVDLKSFTPIRTIGGSMAKPENNKINGTVAYSYPKHSSEPPENNKGNSGSMDSPFDYVKKLMYQEKQLNKWFATSSSKVRNSEETTVDSSHWLKLVEAPLESWYMYEITSTTDLSNKMFLPSYGLRLLGSDYAQNVIVNGDSRTYSTVVSDYLGTDKKGKDNLIEAGTDCLGFASRAASYSGNKYKWYDVPKGWTEYSSGSGTNEISNVFNSFGKWPNANGDLTVNNGTRTYPWAKADGLGDGDTHSYNIFTTRNYDSNAYVLIDDTVKSTIESKDVNGIPNAKKKLMSIVPGDIFVKCSSQKPTTNNKMDSHIAIVAYVPENADEMTVEQLLNSIVLIEAEFGWRVQSVIKTFTLGTYQGLQEPLDLYDDIYGKDASREYKTVDSTIESEQWTLNNRHYAIRRLIWN